MDIYAIDNDISVKIAGEAECISASCDDRKSTTDQRECRQEMSETRIHNSRDTAFFEAVEGSRVLVEPGERLVRMQGMPDQKAADAGEPTVVREPPEDALHIEDIEIAGPKEPEYGLARIALQKFFHVVKEGSREPA